MAAPRHGRRQLVVVAAVTLFGLTALGPAFSAGAPATLTYSTGEIVVNCTSSGQLCHPPYRQRVRVPSGGRVTAVRYTPTEGHCSPVRIHVLLDGREIGVTGFVDPDEESELRLFSKPIRKGSVVLGYRAEGKIGGCNTGQLASWGGTVVTKVTLPQTKIGKHPRARTTFRSAVFTFVGNQAKARFDCKLDRGKFRRCASPKRYTGLALGNHTFRVRSIDSAGNRDSTPARFGWTVLP